MGGCGDDGASSDEGAGSADSGTAQGDAGDAGDGGDAGGDAGADDGAADGDGGATSGGGDGADAGSGGADDATTGADGGDSGGMIGGDAIAFRFNSVAVRDPNFFAINGCTLDVTGTVNDELQNGLMSDSPDTPEEQDGFLDIGFVLAFDGLDQADGATGTVFFANAQCSAPDGGSCSLLPMSQTYQLEYGSFADGVCQEPNADVLSNGNEPGTTTAPCFVTSPGEVLIQVGDSFGLPLTMTTVAARYVGDPAGNLVEGTIQGYLTQEAAMQAVLGPDVPIAPEEPVATLLCADQQDGDGWWMHIDFTAELTEWTEG